MKHLRYLAGAAIAASLTACGINSNTGACETRERVWSFRDPGYRMLEMGVNRIEVRGKSVKWNGTDQPLNVISDLVALVEHMSPKPSIILISGPTSDCEALEAVRRKLDTSAVCEEGWCIEERRLHIWEADGSPPGPPPRPLSDNVR